MGWMAPEFMSARNPECELIGEKNVFADVMKLGFEMKSHSRLRVGPNLMREPRRGSRGDGQRLE